MKVKIIFLEKKSFQGSELVTWLWHLASFMVPTLSYPEVLYYLKMSQSKQDKFKNFCGPVNQTKFVVCIII